MTFQEFQRAVQLAQLKDAVVEAVKERREQRLIQAGTARYQAEMMEAVEALLEFQKREGK
jgi:hypothetical protein